MRKRRSQSVDKINKRVKKKQTRTAYKLLNAIVNWQKVELEQSWKEEKAFTILLLDAFSSKQEKELLARCLASIKYLGTVYLVHMYGDSYPFFMKLQNEVRKEDVLRFVESSITKKDESPLYMTMIWLHYALQRNDALRKVQHVMVVTNNVDTSVGSNVFTTLSGVSFSDKELVRQIEAVLQKTVLNRKWIFATFKKDVYISFSTLNKNNSLHRIYANTYGKMVFLLSKALEPILPFEPLLQKGDEVFFHSSKDYMHKCFHTHNSFYSDVKAMLFLNSNRCAKVVNKVFVLQNVRDDVHGRYKKFVEGVLFETKVGNLFARYLLLKRATLSLKDAMVTLKENTVTKNTDYLMRPCATKYSLEREDMTGYYVKQLNDKEQLISTEYFVPKSYVRFL